MRLHPGVATATNTTCRALVGGFGRPGQRDLDFGEKFIRCAETLEWPEGVAVEDLSYSAHLVLHRLQELRPAKVVFVGAVSRGLDAPGTIRRYRLHPGPPPPEDVHASLVEAVNGDVGLDHTLAVARHWGGLPFDTVVLEVEASDLSFGLGFSEELAGTIDELLRLVRNELDDPADLSQEVSTVLRGLDVADDPPVSSAIDSTEARLERPGSAGIAQLFQYAEAHAEVRSLEEFSRRLPRAAGLSLAARFRPSAKVLWTSGNWYDIMALGDGALGIAMGDVMGHGLDTASAAAQLRTAVRALALVDGTTPAQVVEHLENFVHSMGAGLGSTFLFLSVDGHRGEVLLSNAGHCLPLLITPQDHAEFVEEGFSAPLGVLGTTPKPQTGFPLPLGSTLLIFTTGLRGNSSRSGDEALQRLKAAAANGPEEVEALCDHLVNELCPGDSAGEEDVTILIVRAAGRPNPPPKP